MAVQESAAAAAAAVAGGDGQMGQGHGSRGGPLRGADLEEQDAVSISSSSRFSPGIGTYKDPARVLVCVFLM